MSTRTQPVARIVIIGNEVLSGKVRDANTPFLLKRLRQLGVRCAGVEVVPDEPDVIAAAVRVAAANADWVFTSGGVGPTHDDVTMQSIALAFDVLAQSRRCCSHARTHRPFVQSEGLQGGFDS